jgi:TolA-binding protein
MSDLKLVAPHRPTALEQQLLNAASNEAPSAEQRQRVRLALGLPAVAEVSPPVVQPSRRALAVKGAAGSVVVTSIALLWFSGIGRTPELGAVLNHPALAVPSVPFPALRPSATPQPIAPPLPPAPATTVSANDARRVTKQTSRAATPDSSALSGEDLSEQLRLIDAARSAVAAGNAKGASAAIASYTSRFPRGAFGQEAAVLRIEALDLQGNHAEATSLARSFLSRHPNSPHVSVVQRIADRAQ